MNGSGGVLCTLSAAFFGAVHLVNIGVTDNVLPWGSECAIIFARGTGPGKVDAEVASNGSTIGPGSPSAYCVWSPAALCW